MSFLKTQRERLGMSLIEVAAIAGLSPGELSKLENGKRRARVDHVRALASPLQLTPEALASALLEGAQTTSKEGSTNPVRTFQLLHDAVAKLAEDGPRAIGGAKVALTKVPIRHETGVFLRDMLDPATNILLLSNNDLYDVQEYLRQIYREAAASSDPMDAHVARLIGNNLSRVGFDDQRRFFLHQYQREVDPNKLVPLAKGLALGGFADCSEQLLRRCRQDDAVNQTDTLHLFTYYGCDAISSSRHADWTPALSSLLRQLGSSEYEFLEPCVLHSLTSILKDQRTAHQLAAIIRTDEAGRQILQTTLESTPGGKASRIEHAALRETLSSAIGQGSE